MMVPESDVCWNPAAAVDEMLERSHLPCYVCTSGGGQKGVEMSHLHTCCCWSALCVYVRWWPRRLGKTTRSEMTPSLWTVSMAFWSPRCSAQTVRRSPSPLTPSVTSPCPCRSRRSGRWRCSGCPSLLLPSLSRYPSSACPRLCPPHWLCLYLDPLSLCPSLSLLPISLSLPVPVPIVSLPTSLSLCLYQYPLSLCPPFCSSACTSTRCLFAHFSVSLPVPVPILSLPTSLSLCTRTHCLFAHLSVPLYPYPLSLCPPLCPSAHTCCLFAHLSVSAHTCCLFAHLSVPLPIPVVSLPPLCLCPYLLSLCVPLSLSARTRCFSAHTRCLSAHTRCLSVHTCCLSAHFSVSLSVPVVSFPTSLSLSIPVVSFPTSVSLCPYLSNGASDKAVLVLFCSQLLSCFLADLFLFLFFTRLLRCSVLCHSCWAARGW